MLFFSGPHTVSSNYLFSNMQNRGFAFFRLHNGDHSARATKIEESMLASAQAEGVVNEQPENAPFFLATLFETLILHFGHDETRLPPFFHETWFEVL
mmetsp:Transcript_12730/g.19108  ORF Transcript_12730/g.19108 Transcript_12730/m.19108 type:complete len:97 (+) Transcript_12730:330-620(+)